LKILNRNMRVKDLFSPLGISHSFSDNDVFLDNNNCKVVNKTKRDKAILLVLRRGSDNLEGHCYLRVKKEYTGIESQLLRWAFQEPKITGLTVNELSNLKVGLKISLVNGRMQARQK